MYSGHNRDVWFDGGWPEVKAALRGGRAVSERVTLPEGVVEIKPVPKRNDNLPNFAEHDEDTKNHPIETPIAPPANFRRYLARQLEDRNRGPETVRVVDIGCGRGDTVAWMCGQGW